MALIFAVASQGSNCDYVSDKVSYIGLENITASGRVNIGKAPLPDKLQGVFWLVDDGGDALVSLGAPAGGGSNSDECNNGRLTDDDGSYCATISTVRPGGWSFQAFATPDPGVSGGAFPSAADSFYRTCGTKWKFCFDSDVDPTTFDAKALSTRGLPCVNVFALTTTTGIYQGASGAGIIGA